MNKEQKFSQAIAKKKYLENVRLLLAFKEEKNRKYLTLIFTFLALIFFGLFAINPTFSTILNLKKQIADETAVNDALQTKITNLTLLQQKYNQLAPDLPYLSLALPEDPKTSFVLGQIQQISKEKNVTFVSLSSGAIQMTNIPQGTTTPVPFTLDVSGKYADLLQFLTAFIHFDRIATVTTLSFNRDTLEKNPDGTDKVGDTTRTLHIEGSAYFRP